MITICFKGGMCLDFPKENITLRSFERGEIYGFSTIKDGEKVRVFFKGENVLYMIVPEL